MEKGFIRTYELKSQLKSYTKKCLWTNNRKFACNQFLLFLFLTMKNLKNHQILKKLNKSPSKIEFLKFLNLNFLKWIIQNLIFRK